MPDEALVTIDKAEKTIFKDGSGKQYLRIIEVKGSAFEPVLEKIFELCKTFPVTPENYHDMSLQISTRWRVDAGCTVTGTHQYSDVEGE